MTRLLGLIGKVFATLLMVAIAGVVAWSLWDYYMNEPWTRDGRVGADVVQVSPDVSGLVAEVLVRDNQRVSRGQPLFIMDRRRYQLALAQADAALATQRARLVEATREDKRNHELSNVVSKLVTDQGSAHVDELQAAVALAVADRELAQLNLDRTTVTAPVDGAVTNVELRPGDYLAPGHPAMALVDIHSIHVDGYFEETKLERVHLGDRAEVRLMGSKHALVGHVESIAAGIANRERSPSGDLLPNVNPTFTWVRLAQRVPVKIALDKVPDGIELVVGRTATVSIGDAYDFWRR